MEMIFDIETMEQTGDKPIVRCRDCKSFVPYNDSFDRGLCTLFSSHWVPHSMFSNGFCSLGKRKDN